MTCLVFFDWDGTLVKTLDLKISNAAHLFQHEFGVHPESVEAAYRRHSGIPRRQLFEAICADLSLPELNQARFAALSRQFTQLNRQAIEDRTAAWAVEGQPTGTESLLASACPQTLKTLFEAGCTLYISSSADPDEIRPVAQMLGLEKYFHQSGGEILGSQPGFSKGPQHIAYALNRAAGQDAAAQAAGHASLFFVGDEPADIRLGRQGGAFTIAVAGTWSPERLAQEKPDAVVTSLEEVPVLIFQAQLSPPQG